MGCCFMALFWTDADDAKVKSEIASAEGRTPEKWKERLERLERQERVALWAEVVTGRFSM